MQSLDDDTRVEGVHVTGIQSTLVDTFWPMVEHYIVRAVERGGAGDLTPAEIKERVRQQLMQLWVAYLDGELAGAAITEITVFPRHKVVRIEALGGQEGREWAYNMLQMIEAWARYLGAKAIEVGGRVGWARVLEPLGYRQPYIVLRKEI